MIQYWIVNTDIKTNRKEAAMIIYPAIDLRGGRCVRLVQGDFEQTTEYSKNPMETALHWAECGASWLHLVDLDGARQEKNDNRSII